MQFTLWIYAALVSLIRVGFEDTVIMYFTYRNINKKLYYVKATQETIKL